MRALTSRHNNVYLFRDDRTGGDIKRGRRNGRGHTVRPTAAHGRTEIAYSRRPTTRRESPADSDHVRTRRRALLLRTSLTNRLLRAYAFNSFLRKLLFSFIFFFFFRVYYIHYAVVRCNQRNKPPLCRRTQYTI